MNNALKQDINVTGSLDLQHELKSIKPGDYIHALNFRNIFTENDIDGSGENISSNVQVPFTLNSGTNKCIGYYEDATNNTAFYFIWNSSLVHKILRYYPSSTGAGSIQQILSGSILGFTEWNYVTHVNLVGDLLYWVEGDNPQRHINILKANNTNKRISFKLCFGVPDGTETVIRYQFVQGVTTISVDITFPASLTTRADAADVAYSELSTYAPFTDKFTVVNKGDYLQVDALTFPANIGIWEINIQNISGVLYSWYKAMNWYPTVTLKVLDPVAWPAWLEPDTSLTTISSFPNNFLNGKAYQFRTKIFYEDGEVSTLSKIGRMTYYNLRAVANNAPVDYANYDQSPLAVNAIYVNYNDQDRLFENRELIKSVEIFVRNTNTEQFRSVVLLNDYELDGTYTFFNNTNGSTVPLAEDAKSYNAIPVNSKAQEVVNSKMFYANNKVGYDSVNIDVMVEAIMDIKSWDTLNIQRPKYFGKYNLGIVYFDRISRNNFVNRNPDTAVVIPAPSAVSASFTSNRPYVYWEINHQPPIWATHYAWVRTKELTEASYIKVLMDDPTTIVYKTQAGVVTSWATGNVYTAEIKIKFINEKQSYTFSIGDICRIVFFAGAGGVTNHYDVNIISYDTSTNKVIISYTQSYNSNLQDLKIASSGTPFEFYTPYKQSENELYYEFYECYQVNDPGTDLRAHAKGFEGIDQNILANQPATGYFYYGWDTFHSAAINPSSFAYYNETPYLNLDTNIAVSGIGRSTAIVPENKQVILAEDLAFSDVYNIGTAYNGFGTWEPLSHKNVPYGFGGINLLKNMDNILVAVTKNKSFSIYVDKGVIQGQDGSPVISLSEAVIGAIRDLNGLYGTVNPESFAINDGLLFWWDVYRGVVCQYASNGIEEVSKYNATSYFANKGRTGVKADRTTYKVLGVIHKPFKEYILSFPQTSVDSAVQSAETISFNYAVNGWKTRYSYLPEMMGALNTNLITFKSGNFWLHAKNSSKNNFYGVQYPMEVTSIVNAYPSSSKTMLSMSCESSAVPNFPIITTPITDWNLEGQLSELLEGDFKFINGSYWAPFFMNKLTPNAVSQAMALINGEALQAQTMNLTLSKTANTLFWVKGMQVYFIPDQLTN